MQVMETICFALTVVQIAFEAKRTYEVLKPEFPKIRMFLHRRWEAVVMLIRSILETVTAFLRRIWKAVATLLHCIREAFTIKRLAPKIEDAGERGRR